MVDQDSLFETRRVYTVGKDMTFSDIKNKVDSWDIELQPDYQRDYVMDNKQASRLIESVLMWIPIPVVYFSEEDDERYSIIDWQQRVTSIVHYLKNEFALKGLEELWELNWKKFAELPKNNQRTLNNASLSVIILSKESQELKYEIFARLNQWSIKLKPQELRNCIYRWSFNNLIEELAEKNPYLPTLFREVNKRKNYQEYILRFFALKDFYGYSSSMGKTMNLFMSKHQNDDPKEIEKSRKLFNRTIDTIKQVLWEDAFCAYDRQNKVMMNKFSWSVYDSIIISMSHFDSNDLMRHADEIRKKIKDIKMNNEEYLNYTYAASGSKNRVIWRIMLITNAIREIIWKNSDWWVNRTFTDADKKQLWHDWYICSYCGQEILDINDAQVDHAVPFSLWGETTLENAQLLHRHCNLEKSNNVTEDDSWEEDE